MSNLRGFDQIGADDVGLVGGKGLSLGLMARAGLPVPPGFCVTTVAYRPAARPSPGRRPRPGGRDRAAYRDLGDGPVAVRSSATAEDGATASFAGQQETILGASGRGGASAIERCWASLESGRRAYRHHQGSRRRPGDGRRRAAAGARRVAGVLFTATRSTRRAADAGRGVVGAGRERRLRPGHARPLPPRRHDGGGPRPPRRRQDRCRPPRAGCEPVPAEQQTVACLDDAAAARNWPSWAGRSRRSTASRATSSGPGPTGRFWLLQARPITTAAAASASRSARGDRRPGGGRADPGGTVWGRFNLAEVLPEPTPMTLGHRPPLHVRPGRLRADVPRPRLRPRPVLDDDGVFDLVCGRPYCNLTREAHALPPASPSSTPSPPSRPTRRRPSTRPPASTTPGCPGTSGCSCPSRSPACSCS